MQGRLTTGVIVTGFAMLLYPLLTGWATSHTAAQGKPSDQSDSSETQASSQAQATTIIHIATSASSPADAKRILTGFSMARHSAEAGRKTVIYLNGGAVKLATTGLSLADEVGSVLDVDKQFSEMTDQGIQIYAAKSNIAGESASSDELRSGIKSLTGTELFKKIASDTVVLSF